MEIIPKLKNIIKKNCYYEIVLFLLYKNLRQLFIDFINLKIKLKNKVMFKIIKS